MQKSNIQLHTKEYSTKLTCCQVYNPQLIEVVGSDYARTLELLSADDRYHQVSLFGSAVHVAVDEAARAYSEINGLLDAANITVQSIKQIPFTMEDVFISLVEAQDMSPVRSE